MFFETWSGLARVLVAGICAYAALVLMLRVSGKRTFSKMNAFDFIVTVALGSTLSGVLLSKDVLETDGTVSVIGSSSAEATPSEMHSVRGFPPER
jgi:uncharacterized membrane protein YcaP (DUF421 family)